jgi:hypothetical protein
VSCSASAAGRNRKPLRLQHHIPYLVRNNDSHCCMRLSVQLPLFISLHVGIIQMRKTHLNFEDQLECFVFPHDKFHVEGKFVLVLKSLMNML